MIAHYASFKNYVRQLISTCSVSALVGTIGISMVAWGFVTPIDNRFYDAVQHYFAPNISNEIAVVEVDDDSLHALGRWPWDRSLHADMIAKLNSLRARGIVFAISFTEADANNSSADDQLLQQIAQAGNVAIPLSGDYDIHNEFSFASAREQLLSTLAATAGSVELAVEDDNVVRGVASSKPGDQGHIKYLANAVAKLMPIHHNEAAFSYALHKRNSEYSTYKRTWFSGNRPYETHSFFSVLEEPLDSPKFVKKIVVIGVSATGIGSYFTMPHIVNGPVTTAQVLASQIEAVSKRRYIDNISTSAQYLLIVALAVSITFLLPYTATLTGVILTFTLCVCLVFASVGGLTLTGTWWPPAGPVLTVLIVFPIWSWNRMVMAEKFIDIQISEMAIKGVEKVDERSRLIDRTHRKIQRFKLLRSELEQSRIAQDEAVEFLSHDIRAPMASIAVAIDSLTYDKRLPIFLLTDLKKLSGTVNRTLGLAENFQHLAQARRLDPVTFRTLDALAILEEAIDDFWMQAKAKAATLNQMVQDLESATVKGDPVQIGRLFRNLISNALRYGDPGEPINIAVWNNGGNVCVSISSVGASISNEDAKKIFEKYARGDLANEKSKVGSGLGLAICKTIAESHGGDISLQRGPPNVSIFIVRLPLARVEPVEPSSY